MAPAAHAEMQRGEPSGSSCGAASSEVNANPPAWALPSLRQGQASTGVVVAPPLEQHVLATSDDSTTDQTTKHGNDLSCANSDCSDALNALEQLEDADFGGTEALSLIHI